MVLPHPCTYAQVLDEDAKRTYFFSCNKWLGLGIGDNILERTLVAVEEDPRGSFTEYRVGAALLQGRRAVLRLGEDLKPSSTLRLSFVCCGACSWTSTPAPCVVRALTPPCTSS